MAVVNSSPGTAAALRNMCRKRLFKKAVKQFSLHKNRGLSDDDIVAAFHDADLDKVRLVLIAKVGRVTLLPSSISLWGSSISLDL